jgi:hypothetical protein
MNNIFKWIWEEGIVNHFRYNIIICLERVGKIVNLDGVPTEIRSQHLQKKFQSFISKPTYPASGFR